MAKNGKMDAVKENSPKFEKEEQFRDWLQKELRRKLDHPDSKYIVLDSKNVSDILICKECSSMPIVALVEVKYFKRSYGRIGIGDGEGKGFQPEILIKKPAYFEKYMRWLVASEDDVAVFVDNETVRKFAAGGRIEKGKHNNIQTTIFNNTAIGRFSIGKSSCVIIDWLESL